MFQGIKGKALLVLGLALVVAAAYGLAFQQGRGQLQQQKALYEEQLQQADAQITELQAQLLKAEALNSLLGARGFLFQAAVELDQRNFGKANDYLKESAQALQEIDAADAGVDAAKLDALRNVVADTSLVVAADLEDQRSQLLELAQQMDALIG